MLGNLMITRTQISFSASGESFKPSTLNLPFSQSEDSGSIGKKGRYKGNPIPEGYVSFSVPETELYGIKYLHDLVIPLIPDLRKAGATDFSVHITFFYEDQCALGFSSEETQMLSDFDCAISIDCWVNEKNTVA